VDRRAEWRRRLSAVIRGDVPARFDRETFALLQRLRAEYTPGTDAAHRAEAMFRAP
jgi:hypothetical protein